MSKPKEIRINELPAEVVIVRGSCECGNLLEWKGYTDGQGPPLNRYVCTKCNALYESKDLFPRIEYDVKYSPTEGQRFDCAGFALGGEKTEFEKATQGSYTKGKPISAFNYEILVNNPDKHFELPLWVPINHLSFKVPTDIPKFIQAGWVRISGEKPEPEKTEYGTVFQSLNINDKKFEKVAEADITKQKEELKAASAIDLLEAKWWANYQKENEKWFIHTHDLMFNKDYWRDRALVATKEIADLNKYISDQRQQRKNIQKELEKVRAELVDLKKRFLPGCPDEYRDVNGNCDHVAAAVDGFNKGIYLEFCVPVNQYKRTIPHLTDDEISDIFFTIYGRKILCTCTYNSEGFTISDYHQKLFIHITHRLLVTFKAGVDPIWRDINKETADVLAAKFKEWGITESTPTGFASRDKTVDDLTRDQLFCILETITPKFHTKDIEYITRIAEGPGISVSVHDVRTLYISNKLVVSVTDGRIPQTKGWGVRVYNMLTEWGIKPVSQ